MATINYHPLLTNTTVAKIPIRNIWLLLLYASDYYKTVGKKQRIELETNPEELITLAAKLYCQAANKRLIHHLAADYQLTTKALNRVRGKIDILTTQRKQLLAKGKIQCRYDDLTIDTPKNRYIHAAAHLLVKQLNDASLIEQCRKIIHQFTALNIGQTTYYCYEKERFNHANLKDNTLISLAKLIFSLSIPTQFQGLHTIEQLKKNDHWLRELFEKAIVGFYRVNLDPQQWTIYAGKKLNWQYSNATDNITAYLPTMKTDLILENSNYTQRLIIDTKCTSILKKSRFRLNSFSSHHLYQLYAYLRSQEKDSDPLSVSASGMLLYPAVGVTVNENMTIQGHKLSFCTIDLTQDNNIIRNSLLALLNSFGLC
ncbi:MULTISPECIES: 5-methylcytosine-specific restriction endonuclease system specificity protein McrC [unclassified Gilliamella]|uniref:5-methylcytosine restriction system specificity protein McrC n=1 Tax=unclassified Gilliamella TaxID=2685620 RepID=UPI0013066C21|nr:MULTISPECIES: 5-methylcytosine-specific restriction endonuclease system specificity protein McrC [unclassified Gilliamella]MWP49224.1 5-methylcytosine-specific restriction endonuclease system specificity protein McrC [Gilliamella sp. Lep-s35]MWP67918.1 5-methylcytosine-specific restriction endonuclease system specificity protein McrC [Gilliamella sp. Lep-s5]MWP76138.1 5-methylcytosine-specific restriction endonuclease system specificity protein McrC [Gilliamella sp. Lep-s21]